ncbi:hypothetical protein ACGFMK_22835 [Amycolatopsis sp. NPDC049252]|uniref:hypothetical protein n=1 Tax=Amycolatopsis sp. NPDC049252 TaxID=3363933 RepID=UPI0037163DFB
MIQELDNRGTKIGASRLERWRQAGLLPRNVRRANGRGKGSSSEVPPGVADYVEVLAAASASGRNGHRAALTLFAVGALQPDAANESDSLFVTYEDAVRRAFEWKIDRGNEALRQVRAAAAEPSERGDPLWADSVEGRLDEAYRTAAMISEDPNDHRHLLRAAREGAKATGLPAMSLDELLQRQEQALLIAALGPQAEAGTAYDQASRGDLPKEVFPLDAAIFARGCRCAPRTIHLGSTPEGLRDILRTATFSELNTARAIGGAVTVLAPAIRRAVMANPADKQLQSALSLYNSTFFRGFLHSPAMVNLRQPETIVTCTLAFLHDCAWLRSGAALLATLARRQSESGAVGDLRHTAIRAIVDLLPRAQWIREGLLAPLLQADGFATALRLLEGQDIWMWNSVRDANAPSRCLIPYLPDPAD